MVVFVLVAVCGGFCIFREYIYDISRRVDPSWSDIIFIISHADIHPLPTSLNNEKVDWYVVKNNLKFIYTKQTDYYAAYNSYYSPSNVFNFPVNTIPVVFTRDMRGNLYTHYCGDVIVSANVFLKADQLIHNPENNWPDGAPIPKVSQQAFTCVAIGDTDKDDTFDIWSINDGDSLPNHDIDDSGDDGTRKRGAINFSGRAYQRYNDGGAYFYVLGMLTPLLLLSIAIDIARAARAPREAGDGGS